MSRIYRTLGTVAMTPKGEYDSSAYYEKLDIVTYNGSSYVAIQSTNGNLPTNTAYWQLLAQKGAKTYNTVAEMKADTDLKDGMSAQTLGYYSVNDGGGATYKITNTDSQTEYQEELNSGLYATLIINDYITPEMFGAVGDGTHDDTVAIQSVFNTGRNVILNKSYKCTSNINIVDARELTISGINYNKSALKFVNESFLNIGSNSNVNELRLNNFSILGDRTQEAVLKINYVTNVMLNQINIAEGGEYLLELNHADIVFIDKCTFAGSNVLNIWQPCKGIKVTDGNPIYISNCNIWNLSMFVDIIGLTRTVTLTNNWIEFVNIIINSEDTTQNHMNLIVSNNNITWPSHGDISFSNAKVINLDNIDDGFDSLLCVKNNNIIFYTDNPIKTLIELKTFPGQCNVYIENNIMFTRLSQINSYALIVDSARNTKLHYSSTTNADAGLGCVTSGVTFSNESPRVYNIKNINIASTGSDTTYPSLMSDGQIWYENGDMFIRASSTTKTVPVSQGEEIALIPDTSTVTTADTAAKLNALISILKRTKIVR